MQKNVNIGEIRRKVDTTSPSVAVIRLLREITRLGKVLDKVMLSVYPLSPNSDKHLISPYNISVITHAGHENLANDHQR